MHSAKSAKYSKLSYKSWFVNHRAGFMKCVKPKPNKPHHGLRYFHSTTACAPSKEDRIQRLILFISANLKTLRIDKA